MTGDDADMGEKDILEEMAELLEKNGKIPAAVREKVHIKMTMEILERTRKMQKETSTQLNKIESVSIAGIFRRDPLKATAGLIFGFILLHEFSTFVNVHTILAWLLKVLGIPV